MNVRDIAVAPTGDLYFAGSYRGSLTAGNHSSPANQHDGGLAGFIGKLAATGEVLWLRKLQAMRGRYEQDAAISSIALGGNGKLYAGGRIGLEGFYGEFDPDGNEVWLRRYAASNGAWTTDVIAARERLFVSGRTTGPTAIGGREVPAEWNRDSPATLFASGVLGSVELETAVAMDFQLTDMAVDPEAAYFAGVLPRSSHPRPGETIPAGSLSPLLVSLSHDGRILWTKGFGLEGTPRTYLNFGRATGVAGPVFLAGTIDGRLDFGAGFHEAQSPQGFLVALDRAGNTLWSRTWGKTWNERDEIHTVTADVNSVWVTGNASGGFVSELSSDGATLRSYRVSGDLVVPTPGGAVVAGHWTEGDEERYGVIALLR